MPQAKADLFASLAPQNTPKHIYTVSEITRQLKSLLEANFSSLWIEGEVSNVRISSSQHCYFSLKDEASLLQTVIFSRNLKDIKFKLCDGLKVICYGNLEVYGPQGKYQLIIEKIEPKGIGSLQLALEQLKQKLEKEGLFAPEHKRPIPYLPARVGVVTSLQGAAIKDILKVLQRRFKETHIIISPVRVQGEGAGKEISQAIEDFNSFNAQLPKGQLVEVLIVGRGGGSIEDLWAFNEETVARAIYNSKIPVISSVGHERDVTVADLVADMRASTPSVAAEMVIPRKEELQEELDNVIHHLRLGALHSLELNKAQLNAVTKKLSLLNPVARLEQYIVKISDVTKQLYLRVVHLLKLKEAHFRTGAQKLGTLSPLNILARGYSITFLESDNRVIKDASYVKEGQIIKTKLHKGEIQSKVLGRITRTQSTS